MCYAIDIFIFLGALDASVIGKEVPIQFPALTRTFIFALLLFLLLCLHFFTKHIILLLYFAIPFAILFHLVYLTYC